MLINNIFLKVLACKISQNYFQLFPFFIHTCISLQMQIFSCEVNVLVNLYPREVKENYSQTRILI